MPRRSPSISSLDLELGFPRFSCDFLQFIFHLLVALCSTSLDRDRRHTDPRDSQCSTWRSLPKILSKLLDSLSAL